MICQVTCKTLRVHHLIFSKLVVFNFKPLLYSQIGVPGVVQACNPDTYSHIDPENRTNCDNCADQLKWLLGGAHFYVHACLHSSAMKSSCRQMFKCKNLGYW
jgi:hypothetical protein